MASFYELSKTHHILEKRKNEPMSHEILLAFVHNKLDGATGR